MRLSLVLACAAALATPARAENETAGNFDYYVMALSWSANWCALQGDQRGDRQCEAGKALTFTLHGLWPQYESGYPSYCSTTERDPSRGMSESMVDITGGAGVAWYQWKKHGRCSGLPAAEYYSLMRRAFDTVTIPPVFDSISTDLIVPASVIEDAFVDSNPDLDRDQITVTCSAGKIQEVRICLTTDLQLRRCSVDVIRDCTLKDAELDAVR